MEQREAHSNHLPWFNRTASTNHDSIAIIGGGIASAALAKTLIRRGQNITLYCKDAQPAEGASGNRQGAVYPLLNGPHKGVSRVFAPGFCLPVSLLTKQRKISNLITIGAALLS